jgi:hypothetical protein
VVVDFISRLNINDDNSLVDDSFLDEHLFAVSSHSLWYANIANYLVARKVPPHLSPRERRKIIRKSARYSWIGGYLFYIGMDKEIKICVRDDDIYDLLKPFHDVPCGGHFSDKRTRHTILRMGYFWPTIFQDEKKYVQACDSCQHMSQPNHRDEMPLQPQVVLDIFEIWTMDFVGPINPPSNQKNYILVYTNYMTKWVEAKSLIRASKESILAFLFEDIFVNFGVPRELVIDGGPPFTSHKFEALLSKYHVLHRTTSPYHPQGNG